jgi:hypothetical protein
MAVLNQFFGYERSRGVMRRSLILNPLTVTIALAAVLLVALPPRPLSAMPVKSQAAAAVAERDALIEQASKVLSMPEVQKELKTAGISLQAANASLYFLTNEQLATLADTPSMLSQGEGSTGAAIAIIIGLVALSYLTWRYTKWVDWYQSDLKLRN